MEWACYGKPRILDRKNTKNPASVVFDTISSADSLLNIGECPLVSERPSVRDTDRDTNQTTDIPMSSGDCPDPIESLNCLVDTALGSGWEWLDTE
jgi:hypothetical protein